MSIRYLVPEPVVQYIEANSLYDEDGAASTGSNEGKDRRPGESRGIAPQQDGNGEGSSRARGD